MALRTPSPITGVVAPPAASEFMVTGMGETQHQINYHGRVPKLIKPNSDCYYCKGIRGKPRDVDARALPAHPASS